MKSDRKIYVDRLRTSKSANSLHEKWSTFLLDTYIWIKGRSPIERDNDTKNWSAAKRLSKYFKNMLSPVNSAFSSGNKF